MSGTATAPGEAALTLLAWAEARDWRGHDPFDLLLSPFAAPLRPFRWPSVVWTQIGRRLPWDLRHLLAVPPHENPKALALGVMGCLDLGRAGSTEGARGWAPLARRLLGSQGSDGGWGYPFPWANRHFKVPAGTPSGVVTAFVTQALVQVPEEGGKADRVMKAEAGEALLRGADFVHTRLRRVPTPHGPLLSYTPLDRRAVHNASVLAAAVLARGAVTPGGESAWAGEARAVAHATLAAQRSDGSWPYGTSGRDAFVDSYHTGYVLAALAEVDARVGLPGTEEALRRGYAYWKEAFLGGPAVGPAPATPYPVDLHGVAQGILTLLDFGDRDRAHRLATWALAHARREDGAFVFTWSPGRVNRIAYLRWVQAWMFRALAALEASGA